MKPRKTPHPGSQFRLQLLALALTLPLVAGQAGAQSPLPEPELDVEIVITAHDEPITPHTGQGTANIQVTVECTPPGVFGDPVPIHHRLETSNEQAILSPTDHARHIEFDPFECLLGPSVMNYEFNVTLRFHPTIPAFEPVTFQLTTLVDEDETSSVEWTQSPGFFGNRISIEEVHEQPSINGVQYEVRLSSDANGDLDLTAVVEAPPDHGRISMEERYRLPYDPHSETDGKIIVITYDREENHRDLFQIRFTAVSADTGQPLSSSALFTGNPEPLEELNESPGLFAPVFVFFATVTFGFLRGRAYRRHRPRD